MDNLTAWKTIKIGFLLGIGFMIPSALIDSILIGASYATVSSAIEVELDGDYEESTNEVFAVVDHVQSIELGLYTTTMQGMQLLVQGSFKNVGDIKLDSVEIEAELFDKDGKFVYECSDYISRRFEPQQEENYQIKCGCSKNGLPEYKTINLTVVNASSY